MTDAPQNSEQRDYTLTELDSAVSAGTISQAQRDQIWANQIAKNAKETARAEAIEIVRTETRDATLDGELQEYARLHPDLTKEGTPLRRRVAAEFEALVAKGLDKDSLSTEIAAVRAVMGPIERARAIKEGRRVPPSHFQDMQSGPRQSPQQQRESDAWNSLTPRQRSHYEDLIRKNIYPDRKAALGELKRAAERRGGARLQ